MDNILGIGINELIVIMVLAAIILGPERIARSARQVGKVIRDFKAYFSTLSDEMKNELNLLDDLDKVKKELKK